MYPGSVNITKNIKIRVKINIMPLIIAMHQFSLGKAVINYKPYPIIKYPIVKAGILLLLNNSLVGGVRIKKSNLDAGPRIYKT